MSTDDQALSSRLHGLALELAEQIPPELLQRIAAEAAGRDDIRAEAAGHIAGDWFASPATHYGHEPIAAGLLLLAGAVDSDRLVEAIRQGIERRGLSLQSYDPSR